MADVKVAAYSPDLHGFLPGVNKLGPLCLDEGKNITYGIVLESQPTDVVLIGAKIEYSRDDSPLKLRPPVLLHIHPSEWNITHSMHLASVHDFIDNDVLVEDFEVYHFVQTNDAVFHNTTKYPTASFQVTDHPLDVAGLKYTPAANIIRLNENSEYIITARLNSRPRKDVNVEAIILHTSNEKEVSVTPPSSILDSASNEVTFTVATKVSDYSLKYQFILLIK